MHRNENGKHSHTERHAHDEFAKTLKIQTNDVIWIRQRNVGISKTYANKIGPIFEMWKNNRKIFRIQTTIKIINK